MALFHKLIQRQCSQCHKSIDELYVGDQQYSAAGDDIYLAGMNISTHISLASHFWDIGKQCRSRSGSSLFANRNIYLEKNKNEKVDTPKIGNGLIQSIWMDGSTRQIWVKKLATHGCIGNSDIEFLNQVDAEGVMICLDSNGDPQYMTDEEMLHVSAVRSLNRGKAADGYGVTAEPVSYGGQELLNSAKTPINNRFRHP